MFRRRIGPSAEIRNGIDTDQFGPDVSFDYEQSSGN